MLQAGDVLVMVGDLGAGKTTFTQGLGAGLGVGEPITSPTFTLHRQYEGDSLALHHLDLYRLGRISDAEDLDLGSLVESAGIVVIEWGDLVAPLLADGYLRLRFELRSAGSAEGHSDDDRVVAFEPVGDRWAARRKLLADLADRFAENRPPPC